MTNLPCDVVRDLLPFYVDGQCSDSSRRIMEDHLAHCPQCQKMFQEMQADIPNAIPDAVFDADETVIKKGLGKIRRRWIASLLALILAVPLLLMGFNQVMGRGVCFTNLHEIVIANAYLNALTAGDYEDSFRHVDLENLRESWLERWFDAETMANMEADGLRHYMECVGALEEIGGIEEFSFLSALRQEGAYSLQYSATIGGKKTQICLFVSDNGVQSISGSYFDSTSLEALENLGWWQHNLWGEYEGCYFDRETGQYIYYEK